MSLMLDLHINSVSARLSSSLKLNDAVLCFFIIVIIRRCLVHQFKKKNYSELIQTDLVSFETFALFEFKMRFCGFEVLNEAEIELQVCLEPLCCPSTDTRCVLLTDETGRERRTNVDLSLTLQASANEKHSVECPGDKMSFFVCLYGSMHVSQHWDFKNMSNMCWAAPFFPNRAEYKSIEEWLNLQNLKWMLELTEHMFLEINIQ